MRSALMRRWRASESDFVVRPMRCAMLAISQMSVPVSAMMVAEDAAQGGCEFLECGSVDLDTHGGYDGRGD